MMKINKRKPMIPIMVRLPNEVKEKVKELAQKLSTDNEPITESDIYRTAISIFLDNNFTDSKVSNSENSNDVE